jgi:hypothetical protein
MRRVFARDDGDDAGSSLGRREIETGDTTTCDCALNESSVGKTRRGELCGIFCLAGNLQVAVHARERPAESCGCFSGIHPGSAVRALSDSRMRFGFRVLAERYLVIGQSSRRTRIYKAGRCEKVRDGETASPARQTRALPDSKTAPS